MPKKVRPPPKKSTPPWAATYISGQFFASSTRDCSLYVRKQYKSEVTQCTAHILSHGPQAAPPPTDLGQEEVRGAPVQSLADLEEAIPNSMETLLAEVSHAPPSATRMAPVT